MEETIVLSPLEQLLLNYSDLTRDQELLESLDYVTLMNLCTSSTSLKLRCQSPDIQALLKSKEHESAFIILHNLKIIRDDTLEVDMIIQYPKLLKISLPSIRFRMGRSSRILGNTIDSDIESLVNNEPFYSRHGAGRGSPPAVELGNYLASYYPDEDIVYLLPWERSETRFDFDSSLYHRILVTILELYDLEKNIVLEGGTSGQQEMYIHV